MILDIRDWSISEDRILTWEGHKFDVLLCTDDFILLLFGKDQKHVFLLKDRFVKDLNSSQYYFEKRQKYPEKYKPIWE
ncbi:hypothetical protein ACYSNM_13165 [Myroides sp. LJL116]